MKFNYNVNKIYYTTNNSNNQITYIKINKKIWNK